jgi:tetratricopeptide (TPR) repeat protein
MNSPATHSIQLTRNFDPILQRFRCAIILAAWMAFAGQLPAVAAPEADRTALHALVPVPKATLARSLVLSFGMGYQTVNGYACFWEPQKFSSDIARLQQQLRQLHPPQGALLYRRLGELYHAQHDYVQAQLAFDTAVSLYATQLAQEPARSRDGRFLADYALALQLDGQTEKAEQQVHTALQLAPHAWEVWAAAGQTLMLQAKAATVADRSTVTPTATTSSTSIGQANASAAQAVWREAGSDFDTAVKLAPHLPQPYEMRYTFRSVLANANHSYLSAVVGLSDLEQAVALRPRDPYALAVLAWMEYSDYGMHYYHGQQYDNFDVWKVLPPTKRVALLGIRRRIERLTTSRDPHLRARAYMALAWLEYEFHDVAPAQPQSHLRQALLAEPDLTEAELFLMHTYAVEGQWPALAQFCDERGQRHPAVFYHLTAAYGDYKANQLAQTEAQTRAALKLEPDDLAANLLLTYLLLRNDNPERRKAAGHCLDVADARLLRDGSSAIGYKKTKEECTLLRGFYYALLGKQTEARQQFTQVLDEDKENAVARQGLACLQNQAGTEPK